MIDRHLLVENSRTKVPSHPHESTETRLLIAVFAGQGYAVVAAD